MSNPNPNDQQPSPENTITGIVNPSPIKPVKKPLSKKSKALLTMSMCLIAASVGGYFYADYETKNATGVWELPTEYGNFTIQFAKSFNFTGDSINNETFDDLPMYLPRGYSIFGKNITFSSAYDTSTRQQLIRFNLTLSDPSQPISFFVFDFAYDVSFNGECYAYTDEYPVIRTGIISDKKLSHLGLAASPKNFLANQYNKQINDTVKISHYEFELTNDWNKPFTVSFFNMTIINTSQYLREDGFVAPQFG